MCSADLSPAAFAANAKCGGLGALLPVRKLRKLSCLSAPVRVMQPAGLAPGSEVARLYVGPALALPLVRNHSVARFELG